MSEETMMDRLQDPAPMNRASAAIMAAKRLTEAGHPVREAEGVPWLFDVDGIGRDLTIGQLHDVASRLP